MFSMRVFVVVASISVILFAFFVEDVQWQHINNFRDLFQYLRGRGKGRNDSVLQSLKVLLPQGTIIGTHLDNGYPKPIEAFLGIPYAQPPIGDGRLRRAVPLNQSSGIFHASSYGPICPGKRLALLPKSNDAINASEDCLSLNIFRQGGTGEKLLPVAVYIHGGAFNRGTASMHDTASMVAFSEEPFIGVSFNYRLGALGFLPSAAAAREGVLNLGLHDQILLLEWVKSNIARFGGNPDEVTLIGISAGAHSIGHHLLHYKQGQRPLFHRVIIESGAPTSRAVRPYDAEIHRQQLKDFLEEARCSNIPEDEILTCLRSISSSQIVNASISVFQKYDPSVRWAFQPVIDGDIIPRAPIETWRSGVWNRMPIMTGFNTNEGSMYAPATMSTPAEFVSFFATLIPALSASDLSALDKLYPDPSTNASSPYKDTRPINGIGSQYKRAERAYAHYAYICPVRQTAHLASIAENSVPVFLYHFAVNTTVKWGANHADNMHYETYERAVRAISLAQEEVAGKLHTYWTSFIVHGDPNVISRGKWGNRPLWQQYSSSSNQSENARGRLMLFGEGNDERAGGKGVGIAAQMADDDWSREECEFWWSKTELSEQTK